MMAFVKSCFVDRLIYLNLFKITWSKYFDVKIHV